MSGLPVSILASINGQPPSEIGAGVMHNPKSALTDVVVLLRAIADALEFEARFGAIADELKDLDE